MHRCGGEREWGDSAAARGLGGRGEGDNPSIAEVHRTAASKLGNARASLHGGRCSFSRVFVAHFVHSKAAADRKTLSLASPLSTAPSDTSSTLPTAPPTSFSLFPNYNLKILRRRRGMFGVSNVLFCWKVIVVFWRCWDLVFFTWLEWVDLHILYIVLYT